MKTALVETQKEWEQLVSEWIIKTQAEEAGLVSLEFVLSALRCKLDESAARLLARMSPTTIAVAQMVARSAQAKPKSYPCVVRHRDLTLVDRDCFIQFFYPND